MARRFFATPGDLKAAFKKPEVQQLVIPIVLAGSLIVAAIAATWQFSQYTNRLDQIAIELTQATEQIQANSHAIQALYQTVHSDYQDRLQEIRIEVERVRILTQTHMDGHPDTVRAELRGHIDSMHQRRRSND